MIGGMIMKYCINCNKYVYSHFYKFCPYCGARFDSVEEKDKDYEFAKKYFYGIGVKKNYVTAFDYYSKAARKGLTKAQNDVGECYYFGFGVQVDYKLAFIWYVIFSFPP